jgi:hypothetical protein
MANTKISGLTAGAPAQSGDLLPIARAGSNFSLQVSDVLTAAATVAGLSSIGGLPILSGLSVVTVNPKTFSFGSGDNDFYTVPAGMRAVAVGIVFNPNATSLTAIPKMNLAGAGTRYRINANATAAQNVNAVTLNWNGFVAEAGDIFSLNLSEGSVNVFITIFQFSNTSFLKSPRLATWANGVNTVYTVPVGKNAYAMTVIGQGVWTSGSAVGSISIDNESGATVTYNIAITPSGGSSAAIATASAITNGSIGGGQTGPISLNAGDALTISSTQTGQQLAWLTLCEA